MKTGEILWDKVRKLKLKNLVFCLILIFYSSLLLHQIKLPVADDLGRHIKNGEMIFQGDWRVLNSNLYSYTEPNSFFANHHWLFGVFSYVLNQSVGFDGIVIFKTIILLSAFSLLFAVSVKKANFWLVAFFSIPTILILMERTGFRPEIFSYLFIAFFLYLLTDLEEHPESKKIFWLVPVQLLWVNIHIFFVIGIAMAGGFLFEKIVFDFKNFWKNPFIKKLFLLLALLAIASAFNPQGIRGAVLSFPLNIKGESPILISEDQPVVGYLKTNPFWEDTAIVVFMPAVFILALSFIFGLKRKTFHLIRGKSIFYFLASVVTAILAFLHLRALALFGLIFLPAISFNLEPIFEKVKKRLDEKMSNQKEFIQKSLILLLIVILLAFTFFGSQIGIQKYRNFGIGEIKWSKEAGNFFIEQKLKGPLFNDADVGSYLIYHLYPKIKVFVDNRFGDAYSPDFFRNIYLPAVADEEKWQEAQEKYRFNSIFFYQYDAVDGGRNFLSRRINDPEWALIYVDIFNFIFIRNTQENQEKIAKFRITWENAEEKLTHLLKSNDAIDQIAGADIAYLLGREDLAMERYLYIVTQWPEKDSIWMVMGEIKLQNNDPQSSALAAMYLKKALDFGRKTAEVYSFLGLAYLRLERFDEGREMLKKALEINPERADAKDFLRQLDERLRRENSRKQ